MGISKKVTPKDFEQVLNDFVDETNITGIILEYKKHCDWVDIIEKNNKDWLLICFLEKRPMEFLDTYREEMGEKNYFLNQTMFHIIDEQTFLKHRNDIDLCRLLTYQKLSTSFLNKYVNKRSKILMSYVCKYQELDDEYLLDNYFNILWDKISINEKMRHFNHEEFKNEYKRFYPHIFRR